MIELLELKFSRRWQTNKIESDWSNLSRHSSSRQFHSPRSHHNHKAFKAMRPGPLGNLDTVVSDDDNMWHCFYYNVSQLMGLRYSLYTKTKSRLNFNFNQVLSYSELSID